MTRQTSCQMTAHRSSVRSCALLSALTLSGLLLGNPARAQTPADQQARPTQEVQQLPVVQTDLKRDDSITLPYARLNRWLWLIRGMGEGLFVTRFSLHSRDPAKPLRSDPKLALLDPERYVPIPIDAQGRFDLPSFPPEQVKEMDLASNLPKGAAGIRMEIELSTPPEQLDMATVRRVVRLSQKLRDELLPWYARWLFPQIDGVMVCSDQPQWSLEWPEGGQVMSLALPQDRSLREPRPAKDKDKPARPCTLLTGQEAWPDAARLQPPVGGHSKLHVKLRGVGAP